MNDFLFTLMQVYNTWIENVIIIIDVCAKLNYMPNCQLPSQTPFNLFDWFSAILHMFKMTINSSEVIVVNRFYVRQSMLLVIFLFDNPVFILFEFLSCEKMSGMDSKGQILRDNVLGNGVYWLKYYSRSSRLSFHSFPLVIFISSPVCCLHYWQVLNNEFDNTFNRTYKISI